VFSAIVVPPLSSVSEGEFIQLELNVSLSRVFRVASSTLFTRTRR
jgi:hypothetical protein